MTGQPLKPLEARCFVYAVTFTCENGKSQTQLDAFSKLQCLITCNRCTVREVNKLQKLKARKLNLHRKFTGSKMYRFYSFMVSK